MKIRASEVRLLFGGVCLVAATLTVLEAPTHWLWLVAVGATEWGHWLVLPSLLVLLPGWRDSWSGRLGAGLGILAALLFLTPLVRAHQLAHALPAELPVSFSPAVPRAGPDALPRPAPLVMADVVRGIAPSDVMPRSLVYATKHDQPLKLDLYQPRGVKKAPCVVVIHGGSWQQGERTDLASLNQYLAARGYLVAAISYRFAPRWPFPAARDDVRDALAFLKAHADEFGFDPQQLVLLGRSAGGQLALLVAYATPDPAIRGVIALYAPTDMWFGYGNPSNPLVLDSRGILASYLGGNPATVPAVYDAASPITFVGDRTVPTLLVHGGRDELVFSAQSERLAARLTQARRPHYFLRLPWATHGCDVNFSGPCGQISTYVVERFLAAVTR